jgi:hypothetical protein
MGEILSQSCHNIYKNEIIAFEKTKGDNPFPGYPLSSFF